MPNKYEESTSKSFSFDSVLEHHEEISYSENPVALFQHISTDISIAERFPSSTVCPINLSRTVFLRCYLPAVEGSMCALTMRAQAVGTEPRPDRAIDRNLGCRREIN